MKKKHTQQSKILGAQKGTKKTWENSWTRRIALFFASYIVIGMVMFEGKIIQPMVNAVVPSLIFVIIVVFLYPITKKKWEKIQKKK